MFKKLLPLIVVFALLAAYAGYRAQAAQAATLAANAVTSLDSAPAAYLAWAQALENDRTLPYAGPSLPASGFEYWQMHAGSASEITDYTNLSTGDVAHQASRTLDDYYFRHSGDSIPGNGAALDYTGSDYYERHPVEIIDTNDCNVPRVRSPGARAAPVPSC